MPAAVAPRTTVRRLDDARGTTVGADGPIAGCDYEGLAGVRHYLRATTGTATRRCATTPRYAAWDVHHCTSSRGLGGGASISVRRRAHRRSQAAERGPARHSTCTVGRLVTGCLPGIRNPHWLPACQAAANGGTTPAHEGDGARRRVPCQAGQTRPLLARQEIQFPVRKLDFLVGRSVK